MANFLSPPFKPKTPLTVSKILWKINDDDNDINTESCFNGVRYGLNFIPRELTQLYVYMMHPERQSSAYFRKNQKTPDCPVHRVRSHCSLRIW